MSWAEAVWLRKKTEQAKRLVGSNSSIVKGFSVVSLPNSTSNPAVIGSFIPKYSGAVTIISELWHSDGEASSRYGLFVNGTRIYYEDVLYPRSTDPHEIIYITINVTAGQEYILSALSSYVWNKALVSVGASLSESDLAE